MRDAEVDKDLRDSRTGDVDAFLRVAHKRWRIASDAEIELRQEMLEDKRFMASQQWDERIRHEREQANLPCLTINKLKQPRQQVLHGQREGRPSIQINPVDSGADPKTAEALQGLIRNIESQSQHDVVYGTAGQDQVDCGRGYWRVLTEYVTDDLRDEDDPLALFQQQIRLKRVPNPFSVYVDPAKQEVDYRDARYYFITEDVPTDEYAERFPDSRMATLTEFSGVGDSVREWVGEKHVRIAEYFYVEVTTGKQCLIEVPAVESGKPPQRIVIDKQKVTKLADGVKLIAERETLKRQVKWATINAVEVLEGNDDLTAGRNWQGKWIPIVPVLGDEMNIDGKTDLRGMVRDSRDQNRRYNWLASSQLETLGLASRSPWIIAEGQLEGFEQYWDNANVKRFPYLPYKPFSLGGSFAPPPIRNAYEPAIQSIVLSLQQANDDLQATTGFFDPSLGKPTGPGESGRAIMARQRQGEIGSSNFMDGLSRAIRFTGEILIDLIPHIYDAPRIERILGSDNQQRTVMLHAGQPPGNVDALKQQGITEIYDVSVGRYDVTVSVGPSFESRRQEAVEMMMQAVQANPDLMPIVGDLLFKMVDSPMALEISERLKKSLPPNLQDEGEGGQPNAQQLQGQLQQVQQQLQEVMQAYQQAQQVLATKAQELAAQGQQKQMELQAQTASKSAELQSRERIAEIDAQTRLQLAQMKAQADLLIAQGQINGEKALAGIKAALDEMQAQKAFERDMTKEAIGKVHEVVVDQDQRAHDDERDDIHHERETAAAEKAAKQAAKEGART